MPGLPCLLCGSLLDQRMDKHRKPYFVCDPCGVQLFIRRKQGMERLQGVFENIAKAEVPFRAHAKDLYDIQALIKEVSGVELEIEKIGISHFFSDQKMRIRKALKAKLDNLLHELEKMTKDKREKS